MRIELAREMKVAGGKGGSGAPGAVGAHRGREEGRGGGARRVDALLISPTSTRWRYRRTTRTSRLTRALGCLTSSTTRRNAATPHIDRGACVCGEPNPIYTLSSSPSVRAGVCVWAQESAHELGVGVSVGTGRGRGLRGPWKITDPPAPGVGFLMWLMANAQGGQRRALAVPTLTLISAPPRAHLSRPSDMHWHPPR